MYASLLEASKPLLNYKKQLALAGAGLVLMTLSFGAGLGLMLPIFNFLLNEQKTLGELAKEVFDGPLEGVGNWLHANLPTDPFDGFMLVMLAMLLLTIIGGLGRLLHAYMIARVTARVVQYWRVQLYRRMIRMDMTSYWIHGMADGTSRVMADVEQLYAGYRGILVRSAEAILKVAVALTVAFMINWQMTLFALISGPFIAIVIRKFGKSIRKATKQSMEAKAQMLEQMNESLSDLRVVKMSESEGTESRRYMRTSQRAFKEQVRQHRIRAVSSLVVEIIATIGIILIAAVSAWAIFKRGVPASEFMMILSALVAAGASFKPLSNLHHDLTAADAAGVRILELRDQAVADAAEKRGELPKLPRHTSTIQFEGLSYTYPGAKVPALDGVDLSINFGEMVAIVGGNGSGKSTLVTTLARLIKPSVGRVLIDGRDIVEHDLRSVRGQMAMVTQKTRLFKGTIAENIAYGRSWVSQEEIAAAAKAATADLFINEMPDGYDTPIGEGGEGVSGGQAQRLCIARAVLRDPAILILDEATSQVDTTSEALIAEAMEKIVQGRTTLVIAHRMSTITHADRIVVMDEGKIVGTGKHDELLQNCPQYQALATGQLATVDE
jgi:ABC-type multidrug transport system fused ATPase/permease subunit